MSDSPTGVLKFLFTDEMRLALARHDQVLRAAIGSHAVGSESEMRAALGSDA